MWSKQTRCGGLAGQTGIKTENHIGTRSLAFHLEATEQRRAVLEADQFQLAATGRFKRFGDDGSRAPIGNKRVIGVNGERGFVGQCTRAGQRYASRCQ